MRWFLSLLAVLLLVPGWTGEARLPVLSPDATVRARWLAPAGGWPRQIGLLQPVGALSLSSDDHAFGGYSALALRGDQAVLLSDGGQFLRLSIAGRHLRRRAIVTLRDGPGTGWMWRVMAGGVDVGVVGAGVGVGSLCSTGAAASPGSATSE